MILKGPYGEILFAFLVAIMGLIGNTTIAIFFLRKRCHVNFHRLVIMLSIYDNLSIIMNLSLFIVPNLLRTSGNVHQIVEKENYLIPFVYPVLEIALTGSIYFTLAITIERYLIVCHPFYAISHSWPIKSYMLSISLFCLAYNIPRCLELRTLECQNGTIDTSKVCENEPNSWRRSFIDSNHNCSIRNSMLAFTDLGCSSNYFFIYHIGLDSIFKCILPFVLLLIMNGLIMKRGLQNCQSHDALNKRQSKINIIKRRVHNNKNSDKNNSIKGINKEDVKLAITSMIIVGIFILCYSVIWISKLCEFINRSPVDICKLKMNLIIGYFVTTLNSSIKCYVYFFIRYNPFKYLKSLYIRSVSKQHFLHVNTLTSNGNVL